MIGVPDADKGEVIKAFVVPQAKGVDAAELLRWARDNMSHYKVPRQLEFRASLPASGTGKVLRRLLKEP